MTNPLSDTFSLARDLNDIAEGFSNPKYVDFELLTLQAETLESSIKEKDEQIESMKCCFLCGYYFASACLMNPRLNIEPEDMCNNWKMKTKG